MKTTDTPWPEARQAALDRDHHWPTCHQWGLTGRCEGGLDVHHRLPRGRGGKNNLDNLVTLCRKHHRWVEDNRAAAYELGLLLRSTT